MGEENAEDGDDRHEEVSPLDDMAVEDERREVEQEPKEAEEANSSHDKTLTGNMPGEMAMDLDADVRGSDSEQEEDEARAESEMMKCKVLMDKLDGPRTSMKEVKKKAKPLMKDSDEDDDTPGKGKNKKKEGNVKRRTKMSKEPSKKTDSSKEEEENDEVSDHEGKIKDKDFGRKT